MHSVGGFDSCRNGKCTIHYCLKANIIIRAYHIVLLPLLLLLCVSLYDEYYPVVVAAAAATTAVRRGVPDGKLVAVVHWI